MSYMILKSDEEPSRLISVYQMIGPSRHLMGKFDRSLLEDHHRLKYPKRGKNGYAILALVFTRRPLVQLTVVYVSKM
ncbi:hypothetical protein ACFX15_009647 [Malus domestica]